MRTITPIAALLLSAAIGSAGAQEAAQGGLPRTAAPPDASVYFLAPRDGAEVTSPVTVRFGLRGMGVAPAGVEFPGTGHHHLLVNVEEPPSQGLPLPATEQVLHFGQGQTETELVLAPGTYTLQLVLGDALHIPHDPPVMSEKITITVVASPPSSEGG